LTTTTLGPAAGPAPTEGAGVHQQDSEAFDAFVRARLPHLLRLGRALTGSEQAGADLVQDALERTLTRWSRVRSDDPEGYVRRVMVTRNVSAWRRIRRERLTAEVPERGYDDPEVDQEVWAALATLPPRQRAVLALRYLEDLTEAQTAAVLGVSVGTVKSQASRGMDKLRALLGDTRAPAAAPRHEEGA
jgi:RNA polymerase sigma-70 factor (sigma-E family)